MKLHPAYPRRAFLSAITLAGIVLAGMVWAAPPPGVLDETHASVRAVIAVQDEVTPDLMKLEGILGTAVGLDDNEELALVVYVDRDSAKMSDIVRGLPPQIRGKAVKVELTDKFRAFKPGASGKPAPAPKVDHKAIQTPPIQLGTSGGWSYDLANDYCCGGTLGSLIQVNGVQYILSNYHVLESDIVEGGSQELIYDEQGNVVGIQPHPRTAQTGDPIIQPGLIDVGCDNRAAQAVGTLVQLSSLSLLGNNNVDCSVARVIPGQVKTDGSILEIGTISSQTVGAKLKQAVKKSGRTTGLTSSTVSGLNGTISVAYDNECNGGQAFVKTFTQQIIVANRNSKFLAGGDSGSLLVENVSSSPRAVGLLYAGSNVNAIANPIDEVLGFLSQALGDTASMVGN